MLIIKLKSKIHRCTVTNSILQYEGSCAICPELMESANIQEYEQLHIYNVNTGDRFTTYAVSGKLHEINVLGAAARLVQPDDILIICTYCQISEDTPHNPITVYVDTENTII